MLYTNRNTTGRSACLPSYNQFGKEATCGGKLGMRCPSPTDRCHQYSYGLRYGHCCLGCAVGEPMGICKHAWDCHVGYTCNLGAFPGGYKPKGVCCPKVKHGLYGADILYKFQAQKQRKTPGPTSLKQLSLATTRQHNFKPFPELKPAPLNQSWKNRKYWNTKQLEHDMKTPFVKKKYLDTKSSPRLGQVKMQTHLGQLDYWEHQQRLSNVAHPSKMRPLAKYGYWTSKSFPAVQHGLFKYYPLPKDKSPKQFALLQHRPFKYPIEKNMYMYQNAKPFIPIQSGPSKHPLANNKYMYGRGKPIPALQQRPFSHQFATNKYMYGNTNGIPSFHNGPTKLPWKLDDLWSLEPSPLNPLWKKYSSLNIGRPPIKQAHGNENYMNLKKYWW